MVVAMCADDLTEYVRATFALDAAAPAALMPGARGALGQISRLEIGSRRYAVKELFDDEAPAAALIAAEVEFTALAAAAGVRVAASHPAADGRYVVPMPGGSGWLRLYDWLDAGPLDLGADDLPLCAGCSPPTARPAHRLASLTTPSGSSSRRDSISCAGRSASRSTPR